MNVGIIVGFTVIVKVVVVEHCPEVGVKVYVVVAWLFSAGLQVPVIPFSEFVGKATKTSPWQIGLTALKVGIIVGLTLMLKVVVVEHCPGVGVKVYVVVTWLFSAGLQVPVIPLSEFVGKAAKTSP